MRNMDTNDFYEDDEDPKVIARIFHEGEKGATTLPGGAHWGGVPESFSSAFSKTDSPIPVTRSFDRVGAL